ncbi:MAG: hypothetical protein JW760_14555 [Spirochaetales bacterium]|nr:hypothetical protein [Spirochaetales bacterium]
MKKFFPILLILLACHVWGDVPSGVDFSIRFYDKTIYYTGSPVFIRAELNNDSPHTFRFRVADSRVFNLDFDVRSLTNSRLPYSRECIIQRNTNQPVFVREIVLEPGEQYSFIEELSNFIDLENTGAFVVRAHFYPDLTTSAGGEFLVSNPLQLTIRPDIGAPAIEAALDEQTGEILQKNPLPPDEVVDYMLTARQKSQWEKFFLYLDVTSLMLRDPEKERRYARMTEEERLRLVTDYKKELSSEITDNDIVIIPDEYEILQTSYTPQEGQVEVLQRFRYTGFTEVKRFTYYLQRKGRVWMIYNYEVRNLGTE